MNESNQSYEEFLDQKSRVFEGVGFEATDINPALFDYQKAIIERACKQGRFALFEECGLGKSIQELEWASQVVKHTGKPVILLAPLAVGKQFISEATKFNIEGVKQVKDQSECVDGRIFVTNYEKIHKFDSSAFGGIVLDESSILKGFGGKVRQQLTEFADTIPYRLCGTATPSPNDLIELTNHAEFLGVMREKEVKAMFFTQDGNNAQKWRMKHHAYKGFYKWLASWAVAIRSPEDLGFKTEGYDLPPLRRHQITVEVEQEGLTTLFALEANTLQERQRARRDSLTERVEKASLLVNDTDGHWVVWCDLNDESAALTKMIDGAVEVTGSMSEDKKKQILEEFTEGKHRVLVSKPQLAGFGLNWQHCHQTCFVGVSDSFEQQYQAIRRFYRFGQTKPVDVYYITSTLEGRIIANIERKQDQHNQLMYDLAQHMTMEYQETQRQEMEVQNGIAKGKDYTLYMGDSVERIDEIADNSVGLTVFSPPFPGMYAYSNSSRDIGNSGSIYELVNHFKYLAEKMLRIMKPGRNVCIHLTQEPVFKGKDGHIGLRDFRGEVIRTMENAGFNYYCEITIDKNPQLKAIRTKDHSLMFSQLAKDSAFNRVAMADYVVVFKKPGDNSEPVRAGTHNGANPDGWISNDEWIRWARPVWYGSDYAPNGDGISETDVLNVRSARESDDERHLCPLQLGVIERCVKLWSNPGDTVFSPFAGIGSEGYRSIELNRKFVGIELKKSYFDTAKKNLDFVESSKSTQLDLFSDLAAG